MKKSVSIVLVTLLWGCQPKPLTQSASDTAASQSSTMPQRIVSLDYCADQFVLKLADRSQILALSKDSRQDFAYMAKEAATLPQISTRAEDILLAQPDLIVTSYGGGPAAEAFFQRAGLKVAKISNDDTFDGIKFNIRQMGMIFGHPDRGESLVQEFETRLLAATRPSGPYQALYVTAGGISTGPGSMIDTMFKTAGFNNFVDRTGWAPLPLEKLATQAPDVIVTAFFSARDRNSNRWSAANSALARRQLNAIRRVDLNSATTSCGGWFIVDGIEAMARAHDQLRGVQ